MILTGQLDSPFVRRVAVALHLYGFAFKHNVISAYGDFDELLILNPLGKVPALELDNGCVLVDSTLILDYLDRLAGRKKSLWPGGLQTRARLLAHMGVAAGLAEAAVEYRTETVRRPSSKIDQARINRILAQINTALDWLETHTPPQGFISGDKITHADIASTVAITFIANKNPKHLDGRDGASIVHHALRCEAMAPFKAAPFTDG